MRNILFLFIFFLSGCSLFWPKKTNKDNNLAVMKLKSWEASIDLTSLVIYGQKPGIKVLLTDSLAKYSLKPVNIKTANNFISCSYPDLDIDMLLFTKNDRLHIRIIPKKPHSFFWPNMGIDNKIIAFIAPIGEGLYIPNNDLFWHKNLKDLVLSTEGGDIQDGGILAPFWGYDLESSTISFIAHSDINTYIKFYIDNGRLVQSLYHDFTEKAELSPYEISIALTEKSVLAPAFHFKKYLIENDTYKTLQKKIDDNPEVSKLSGALHAYMWGDGRTVEALQYLNKLGIKRMWIGYEDKPYNAHKNKYESTNYVTPNFIEQAKKLGFLVGPYDSFHTMQSPEKVDSANDYFGNQYPSACILSKEMKQDVGFAGRGCHASSEAFVLEYPKNHI